MMHGNTKLKFGECLVRAFIESLLSFLILLLLLSSHPVPGIGSKTKYIITVTSLYCLMCVIPVVCRKTNGEVNISHGNIIQYICLLQLGCHPVAVVTLHVNKT